MRIKQIMALIIIIGTAHPNGAIAQYAFAEVKTTCSATTPCLSSPIGTTAGGAGAYYCLSADGTRVADLPEKYWGSYVYLSYTTFTESSGNPGTYYGYIGCSIISQGCPTTEYWSSASGCESCQPNTFSAPAMYANSPAHISRSNQCGWCMSGYYYNDDTRACTKCPLSSVKPADYCDIGEQDDNGNCFYFQPGIEHCGTCPRDMYLDAGGTCVPCPENGRRFSCARAIKTKCILPKRIDSDEAGEFETGGELFEPELDDWENLYSLIGEDVCNDFLPMYDDMTLEPDGAFCPWAE